MTLGKAIPTPPSAPGSRAASAASTGIMAAGVELCGVGAEINPPVMRPESTSTRPALIEEPPTSMPSTLRVTTAPSQVGGGRELLIALAASLLIAHPYSGDGDAGRDQQHQDGGERVDVGRHPEAHLGEHHHRQRTRARSGDELGDDEIVP